MAAAVGALAGAVVEVDLAGAEAEEEEVGGLAVVEEEGEAEGD